MLGGRVSSCLVMTGISSCDCLVSPLSRLLSLIVLPRDCLVCLAIGSLLRSLVDSICFSLVLSCLCPVTILSSDSLVLSSDF